MFHRSAFVRLLAFELWCVPPPADAVGGDLVLADGLREALDWLDFAVYDTATFLAIRTVGHGFFPRGRQPSGGSLFGPEVWADAHLLLHRPRVYFADSSQFLLSARCGSVH